VRSYWMLLFTIFFVGSEFHECNIPFVIFFVNLSLFWALNGLGDKVGM
jgi:hypothetical protein